MAFNRDFTLKSNLYVSYSRMNPPMTSGFVAASNSTVPFVLLSTNLRNFCSIAGVTTVAVKSFARIKFFCFLYNVIYEFAINCIILSRPSFKTSFINDLDKSQIFSPLATMSRRSYFSFESIGLSMVNLSPGTLI